MSAKRGLKSIERVIGRIKKDITDLANGIDAVETEVKSNTDSVLKKESEFLALRSEVDAKNGVLNTAVENAVSIKENLEKVLGL